MLAPELGERFGVLLDVVAELGRCDADDREAGRLGRLGQHEPVELALGRVQQRVVGEHPLRGRDVAGDAGDPDGDDAEVDRGGDHLVGRGAGAGRDAGDELGGGGGGEAEGLRLVPRLLRITGGEHVDPRPPDELRLRWSGHGDGDGPATVRPQPEGEVHRRRRYGRTVPPAGRVLGSAGMSLVAWAVVGLLAGWLASRVVGTEGRGCIGTMVVGVLGAFIGGALYSWIRGDDVEVFDDFDLGSIFVAILGAVALLLVLEAIGGRSTRR